MILAVVEDLIFLSKIQQTAKLLGVPVETVGPGKLLERLAHGSIQGVILDLNHRSGTAVDILRALKANPSTSHLPVVGFVSHVQDDLIAAARAAGCDQVLARSAFTVQLPQLLDKWAGGQSAAPSGA